MPKLTEEQIQEHLKTLKDWRWEGKAIIKELTFPSFKDTMAYVNRVAQLAEEVNHHPDIDIRYKRVTLTLYTHTEGGLTQRDFRLAERINALNSQS